MEELNQRFQHIETSLEKTAKAVSINSERIDGFERRLDLCEMKQRENNLIFYGIKGKEGEAPTDTRAIIMNLISEKMQIQENITIQQCRRLTKNANSPILIEVPEHNERIMLFKNMFRLKNTRIYLNKDYSCADAFRMLTVAYGEATLDRSNIYRWYKMFSEGREDVNDEERARRPEHFNNRRKN
ncbi:hypothetical protein LAZ67_3004670 [Cordylochernes scorpioides]|uniref:Mos1 transposase HTH domain-containing protein n=1 Tax=Cordylochernes scorpioides TaxID=51811 RepID=A0ABY6KEB5_9ARAC|nr:hypothetical protein LAZ67_3004670 [Cordylochernes scorpioides]